MGISNIKNIILEKLNNAEINPILENIKTEESSIKNGYKYLRRKEDKSNNKLILVVDNDLYFPSKAIKFSLNYNKFSDSVCNLYISIEGKTGFGQRTKEFEILADAELFYLNVEHSNIGNGCICTFTTKSNKNTDSKSVDDILRNISQAKDFIYRVKWDDGSTFQIDKIQFQSVQTLFRKMHDDLTSTETFKNEIEEFHKLGLESVFRRISSKNNLISYFILMLICIIFLCTLMLIINI
jgi:hypothetical protein